MRSDQRTVHVRPIHAGDTCIRRRDVQYHLAGLFGEVLLQLDDVDHGGAARESVRGKGKKLLAYAETTCASRLAHLELEQLLAILHVPYPHGLVS